MSPDGRVQAFETKYPGLLAYLQEKLTNNVTYRFYVGAPSVPIEYPIETQPLTEIDYFEMRFRFSQAPHSRYTLTRIEKV